MKFAHVIIFTNHFTQVFQVARLFQTEEVTRTFFMQHVDVTLDTKSINQCQFGLYKRGPLTPIPVHKVKQYGELIAIVYSGPSFIQLQVSSRLEYPHWLKTVQLK